mgnify:FL=1
MDRRGAQQNVPLDTVEETTQRLPAVGLVATPENGDWIASEIIRIKENGYRAIVTARRDEDYEALRYARMLGAKVLSPPSDWTTAPDAQERLTAAARANGYPGLLYHTDTSQRIDFEASYEALRSSERFVIEAAVEPVVESATRILVGIPAFNEASSIASVVEVVDTYADEVLVVDDGSDDDTAAEAKKAGATVVEHETNGGYGAALKTIFTQANRCDADHLVILDADGQHDASDISNLVRKQRETDAHIVIGCRFGQEAETEMPLYRRFGLSVINLLTNLSLGIFSAESRVRDSQSGFRAYNREAIASLAADDSIGDNMDCSLDILYHAHSNGYQIEEVPTTIDYDVESGSSHSPINHGITLVMNIVRTIERERPITMLGVPGVVSILMGFAFAYWSFFNYLQSGEFPIGLALFASCLAIVGILAAFTGIILHSLEVYRQ